MTEQEALKLALEALEEAADAIDSWGSYASGYFQVKHDLEGDISKAKSAITAIKEALEQPEQETTDSEMFKIRSAYQKGFEHGMEQSPQRKDSSADALIRQYVNALVANKPDEAANATKQMVDYVYTSPPQRKPLTEEEIFSCENSVPDETVTDRDWCIYFARAIEAAHGIKGEA